MQKRSRIGWLLTLVFLLALAMGPGPGMELANYPVGFCGFPVLYMWGLLWFAVQVSVVVLAYLWVWPTDEVDDHDPSSADSG